MQLACAVGDAVLLAEGAAVPVVVAVGLADAEGLAVADLVVAGAVAFGVSSKLHGGRLVPVPSCRSLMICSASPKVEAGTVLATSCCEYVGKDSILTVVSLCRWDREIGPRDCETP
jgi:hypothetical protein